MSDVGVNIFKKKKNNKPKKKNKKIKQPALGVHPQLYTKYLAGWLGWAMMLDSLQSRGVLLLLHILEQGSAVLAAGAGRWAIYSVFSSIFPF